MTFFTEEQLASSVGYFVGYPGVILQNGEWTIIRKLGWGPRSSTWLAVDSNDSNNIEAIKIFTVAATKDPLTANEVELLQGILKENFHTLPSLRSSFYEESAKGKHLALVLHVLGSSVESFHVASGGSLPLKAVKKIVADVLESLATLEQKKTVHGAVTADNLLFGGLQQGPDITAAVAASPSAPGEDVSDILGTVYKAVKSQPFSPESVEVISNESVYLSNFAHARPESGDASNKSDLLSLGAIAYLLLTGSKVSAVPQDVEESLTGSGKLSKEDVLSTAAFFKYLFAAPSAHDLLGNSWLQ